MKERLKEVDIIRFFVIISLVLYHCLAPYTGGWKFPDGLSSNQIYWWFGKFVYNGMLETFVFISGYVFANSLIRKNYQQALGDLVVSKIKRLWIPCIFWGIIYILIMSESQSDWSDIHLYYSLFNGVGHLWFLPMLFWCFIFEYFIIKSGHNSRVIALILFFVAILPYPTLPLRLHSSLYYLFFFHMGFVVKNIDINQFSRIKTRTIALMIIVYLILFITITMFLRKPELDMSNATSIIQKAEISAVTKIFRLFISLCAVAIYYVIGIRLVHVVNKKIYNKIYFISLNSMGIYLLQEIVIRIFYYKTNICLYLDYYSPWVVFMLSFALSLLLSYLMSKNKVTRCLC